MTTRFDEMTDRFSAACERARDWRDAYPGAAYRTRIRAAIADLKKAIAMAEANEEIGPVETLGGELR